MGSYNDNMQFIQEVISSELLNESVDWISSNMNPEDVFSEERLKEWAENWSQSNNYIFEEDKVNE